MSKSKQVSESKQVSDPPSKSDQKSTTDESVFRRRMIERLAAVDELSEPLRLDPLKGWPMWLAVLMLMVFAGFGSVLATAPVTVEAEGVIKPTSGTALPRAVLYTDYRSDLRPGQLVRLEAAFGEPTQLRGRIAELSPEPGLRRQMGRELGDPDLAARLYDSGRRMRVTVALDANLDADLDMAPAEAGGPEAVVPTRRRPVLGRIEIETVRPIDLLLPSLSPREARR